MEDGATARGNVNTVQRVGDTVRRPIGRWTPTVHALLRHLEDVGFAGAPRVLGIDEHGREVLSYLPGEVARRPWPAVLRHGRGLAALAQLLREYHAAVRGFRPPTGAQWRAPDVAWRPGHIVRHGDIGPWNSVWDGDRLVGLIDWEFAEPGHPLEDIAQLAWYAVPLRAAEHCRAAGFDQTPDQRQRLHALCEAYGTGPRDVLDALVGLQAKELARTSELARRGVEPWASFAAHGDEEEFEADAAWLAAHYDRLLL